MKIYGEMAEVEQHEGFTEMSGIAISLSAEAMEKFADFVMHAASEMKRKGNRACQIFCVCRGHEIIPKGIFRDRSNDHQKTTKTKST